MADAVTPATFAWADLVAGYVDGRYQSFAGMAAANPGKRAVSIATQASTRGADVYDCETGDLTAWQLVDSVTEDRAAGRWPSGYFSEASRATVETSFSVRGVPLPPEWIAGYPGSVGYGNLYPGSPAHQDADLGPVDHSTVIDNPPGWPGIDTPPAPASPGGDVMLIRNDPAQGGDGAIYALTVGQGRHLLTPDQVNRIAFEEGRPPGNAHPWAVIQAFQDRGAWRDNAPVLVP